MQHVCIARLAKKKKIYQDVTRTLLLNVKEAIVDSGPFFLFCIGYEECLLSSKESVKLCVKHA